MVGIPQCRASAYGKVTIVNGKAVYVPERIIPLETAIGCHDVAALFDARFSFADGHVIQVKVVRGEQRAFAPEFFVFINELQMILPRLQKGQRILI